MNKRTLWKITLYIVLAVVCLGLMVISPESLFFVLSFAVFGWLLLTTMWELGRRIIVLRIMGLLAVLQWLVAPSLIYMFFPESNWALPIPAVDYFIIVFPGTVMLLTGLFYQRKRSAARTWVSHEAFIERVETHLASRRWIGLFLFAVGSISLLMRPYMPIEIRAIFTILSQLIFVGALYLVFSGYKGRIKYVLLIAVALILLAQTILSGMFGELIFWSVLLGVILLLKTELRMYQKWVLMGIGLFALLLMQSIKTDYRQATWDFETGGRSGDAYYMSELVVDRVVNPTQVVNEEGILGVVSRASGGLLIARVIEHVPKTEPYAYGETVLGAVSASLVPRFLWPDKPQTGGWYTYERFTGYKLNINHSANVSPLGEGYANFGPFGTPIYMWIYGLFFGVAFRKVLKLTERYPTLVLWTPLMFIGSIAAETDLLTTLNSFIKAALFVWVIYNIMWILLRRRI